MLRLQMLRGRRKVRVGQGSRVDASLRFAARARETTCLPIVTFESGVLRS